LRESSFDKNKYNILTDLPKRPFYDPLTCHRRSRLENSPYIMVCVSEKHAHGRSIVTVWTEGEAGGRRNCLSRAGLAFSRLAKPILRKKKRERTRKKPNMFLVISCHRNRDRLQLDGPLD